MCAQEKWNLCLNYYYNANILKIMYALEVVLLQFYFTVLKLSHYEMSRIVRKQAFCICENKDADQLRGNREPDQCLCFRYIDS